LTAADIDQDPRYQEVLSRLQSRGRFGVKLGLERTRALLKRLGNPEKDLRGALIGGTNGKGSTQQLVASVLRKAGYRVGQTPKPHLVSYRERIVVDGQLISATDFADVVGEALVVADKVEARYGAPTEFEVLTAAAFTWFKRSEVDVAVVEVGLGGRLDATNVWQGGVSAITNVALDHMEYLGDTVEKIALEKAQIIKSGDARAVTGAVEPALTVVRARATHVGVPLQVVDPLPVTALGRDGTTLLIGDAGEPRAVRAGLLGRHQALNAAVALGILDGLAEAGIATTTFEERMTGFANARWPGRMELVSVRGRPDILLDGAHNPDGMAALGAALREMLPQMTLGSPTILMAILANHWQAGMLDPLIDAVPNGALFATRVPDSGGSMDPYRIQSLWGAGAVNIADPQRAYESAWQRATQVQGPLIVCGSLYLVGFVRGLLETSGAVA
jgi:dihydrofolate synthase/folylpolyglutamate synthase